MIQAGPWSRPAADPGPAGHVQHPPRRGRGQTPRPRAAGAGAALGGRRRHLPAGGRPVLRRPQRGRRPGAAALPGAGHAAGLGPGDRRACAGEARRGSTATRCCPGCRSWSATSTGCRAAASRAAPAHDDRARRRHAVGDQHAPEHRRRRRAPAGGRAGRPAHRLDGGRGPGRRLQHRPEAPELAALRERFADAWELADERDDRAGWRFWQHDEGHTHPAHAPHRRIDQVWVSPARGFGRRRGPPR